MDKTYANAAAAVADMPDGASLAMGGFGLSGNPMQLIDAVLAQGATALSVVSTTVAWTGGGSACCWRQHASAR